MINFNYQHSIITNQAKLGSYRLFQADKYSHQLLKKDVRRQPNYKKSSYIVLKMVILVFWLSMTFNLEFIGMVVEVKAEESTAEKTKESNSSEKSTDNEEEKEPKKANNKEKANNKDLTGHKKPKKKT